MVARQLEVEAVDGRGLSRAAYIVAAMTASLALGRIALMPEHPLTALILMAGAVGFATGGWRVRRTNSILSRNLLPSVAVCTTVAMAFSEQGLYSESLFWLPFVPGAALIADRNRSIQWTIVCLTGASALLAWQLRGGFGAANPLDARALWLRWLALQGGIVFGFVLAWIYDTARATTIASLRSQRLRLRTILDNMDTAIAISDEHGRLVAANRRLSEIFEFGESTETLVGKPVTEAIRRGAHLPKDLEATLDAFRRLSQARRSGTGEIPLVDGRVIEHSYIPIASEEDSVGHLWSFRDVTARLRRHSDMLAQLRTDEVSQVATRSFFAERLRETCDRNMTFALLFLDLDKFKEINDTHGHACGDALLGIVGDRLRDCVRASDVVGRYGGDEFTLIALGISSKRQATTLAKKIIDVVALPIDIDGISLQVGVSIGVVLYGGHGAAPEELMRQADRAMYEAKAQGGNRYHLARPTLRLDSVG